MMRLAGAVGIEVPEVRLVRREQIKALPERLWVGTGDYAYAVRRFDRGPRRRLIHMEDLAQVRSFYRDWKYRGSFETLGALDTGNTTGRPCASSPVVWHSIS